MKRRSFIKKAAVATAGLITAPYILSSGRLFAKSGTRLVDHVVFCLYAGGVRNLESVQKADGNLMPYSLSGTESISGDIAGAMSSLPERLGSPLQSFGTLFKEFRYASGPTGHYNGHTTALTGNYTINEINLKQSPKYPTVFEYYRKHSEPSKSALNAWWIADSLGPYPQLNYSEYPGYGPLYGANYMQPGSLISPTAFDVIGNPKSFGEKEFDQAEELRSFFNSQFDKKASGDSAVSNTLEDQLRIQAFIQDVYSNRILEYSDPWGIGTQNVNNDVFNLFAASKVLEEFKPELLVVNMQGVDICHSNFTQYCDNLRKADFALYQLWNSIQQIPEMRDNTLLIAAPEHGRNLEPNTVIDGYGRFAIDHTNTDTAREIFCMILGPQGIVNQNNSISSVAGESIDVVPTIARALGFYDDIPRGMLPGRFLEEAFI